MGTALSKFKRHSFFSLWVLIALLFKGSAIAETVQTSELTGPRIFIPNTSRDFGEVAQGAILEEEFKIKNIGTKDLIIRSLDPACGCTSAVINDPVIKPGSESSIRLSFNTLGFRGDKEKVLRIYSNDPLNSSQVVTVKANIKNDIVFSPEALELGEVTRSKGFSVLVTLESPTLKTFKIKEVIPKANYFDAEVVSAVGGTYKIKLSSNINLPLGNERTRLIAKTDSESTPTLILPINFYVQGDLVVTPKSINFGFIQDTSSGDIALSRILRISKATEAQKARVSYIEKSNRGVDAELSEDSSGQYVTLRINSLAKGVVRGNLELYTDSEIEGEKIIEVPYFAVVDSDVK